MEVRVSFTISEYGSDPQNGERFMDAFMQVFAEGGPSVLQNTEAGTLTITFALDANDAKAALGRAGRVFAEGANATGLPPTEVLEVEAAVVRVAEADSPAREPVPA